MSVDYDETGRQRLHINVENKHGVDKTDQLISQLQEIIHRKLISESSEYRETSKAIGEIVKPLIHLWDYEDPKHFRSGGKQKWVKK
jgi:hypothetical protein